VGVNVGKDVGRGVDVDDGEGGPWSVFAVGVNSGGDVGIDVDVDEGDEVSGVEQPKMIRAANTITTA
jgi:hypothetical protein